MRMLRLEEDKSLGPNHMADRLATARFEPESMRLPRPAFLTIFDDTAARPQPMLGC